MKIALLSDIHANLPAFTAALNSIDLQKPDAIYCLGDLVGYNVWPNEVINEIRKRRIPTIAGNHDVKVKNLTKVSLADEKNFAYSIIGEEEKHYLATLPAHIRVEFQVNNNSLNLLLVHGSPSSNTEYLLEDKDEQDFLETFKQSNADILCFGHSHKPYHRILNAELDGSNHFYHAINLGSVGKPKDGDNRGCYVILTLNENSSYLDKESIKVEFIRFEYDIDAAIKGIEESPLPKDLIDRLCKAF